MPPTDVVLSKDEPDRRSGLLSATAVARFVALPTLSLFVVRSGISTEDDTAACAERITGKRVPAEINPPDNRPVSVGPIYANHSCNAPQLPAANH